MRVLLDESVPHDLALALTGHEVTTVQARGWAGLANGVLLRAAREAGVEALVTVDRNMEYQQHIARSASRSSYSRPARRGCATCFPSSRRSWTRWRVRPQVESFTSPSNVSLLLTSELLMRLRRNGDTSLAAELGR